MFILTLVCATVALIALGAWKGGLSRDTRSAGRAAFTFFFVLTVLSGVISCLSVVPTRNVGIVTAFNKPTGRTTGAGLQWTAPWQGVDDWDASGQTYSHLGDHCVWVTIAAQRRACIPVQVEWQSRAERAPENWAAYKEVDGIDGGRFGTFVARRVEPQMTASLVSTFASFDPLGAVNAAGDVPAPDLNKLYRKPLENELNKNLGQDVHIRSIAFGTPGYDRPTTDAIAAYGQKMLEARNLAVDKQNADTRAAISKIDASVPQIARCLQIAEKLGKEPGLCMGAGNNVVLTKPVG